MHTIETWVYDIVPPCMPVSLQNATRGVMVTELSVHMCTQLLVQVLQCCVGFRWHNFGLPMRTTLLQCPLWSCWARIRQVSGDGWYGAVRAYVIWVLSSYLLWQNPTGTNPVEPTPRRGPPNVICRSLIQTRRRIRTRKRKTPLPPRGTNLPRCRCSQARPSLIQPCQPSPWRRAGPVGGPSGTGSLGSSWCMVWCWPVRPQATGTTCCLPKLFYQWASIIINTLEDFTFTKFPL